jgi:hypothetical protein
MIGMAVVAVGLLSWIEIDRPAPSTVDTVVWVDRAFCAVFAVEFLYRWGAAGWDRWFPLRNWYDLIGMIPVAEPFVRAFRLLRIAVVFAAVVHAGRLLDRLAVQLLKILARIAERFIDPIIDVIKRPITVAVLDEVVDVLRAGHYSKNVATAVEENRDVFRELILEKLKEDPQAGKFRRVPFYDDIVGGVTDTVIRVFLDVLADPRTDNFVEDLMRQNVEQIRGAIRSKPLFPVREQPRAGSGSVAGSKASPPDGEGTTDGIHAPGP